MAVINMKKVVKGFFLFLILLVGVSYSVLAATSECDDGRHGVEIDGSCYYCGDSDDGVCPSFYGAQCDLGQIASDPDCGGSQEEGTALWYAYYDESLGFVEVSEEEIQMDSGENLFYAVVESPEIQEGDKITFKIKRDGSLGNPLITSSETTAEEDGLAYLEWAVEKEAFQNGGQVGETAEFFFEATKQSSTLDLESGNLKLTIVSGATCAQVQSCNDYIDEESCGAIEDASGDISITEGGDFCNKFYTEATIEEPPGCIGTEYYFCLWNGTGCNLRDEKVYDPETANCVSTSCDYVESGISGDCDTGESVVVTYNPLEGVTANCPVKQKTYICPSLVELPFFTGLNLVIAIIVIVGVYIYLSLRKKSSKKRR